VVPAFAQGGTPASPATPAKQPEADKPKTDDTKTDKPAKEEPKLVYVNMKTSMGDLVIELNQEKAPITVKNFLNYVDKKHFDGTIFHRVIPTFVLQGGGFTEDYKQKDVDKPIKNEWQNGLKNVKGSLSMARTMQPDSATSQFFVNVKDNPDLDQGGPRYGGAAYAVFGRVVSGMDVVDQIRVVPTGSKRFADNTPMQDVPQKNVVIKSVTRMSDDEAKKFNDAKPAATDKK